MAESLPTFTREEELRAIYLKDPHVAMVEIPEAIGEMAGGDDRIFAGRVSYYASNIINTVIHGGNFAETEQDNEDALLAIWAQATRLAEQHDPNAQMGGV